MFLDLSNHFEFVGDFDEAFFSRFFFKTFVHIGEFIIFTGCSCCKILFGCTDAIKVFKPEANFVLIKLLKEEQTASDVFDYCIKKGFMIRDCTDYEGLGDKYIRFCFMKPEQNDNVVNTILEIV